MSNFVDECNVCTRAGDGGAGSISFRREAHVPKGGPDGGDGGSGGSVWLEADRNVASLLAFRDYPHRIADSGTHGHGAGKNGKTGPDLVVMVPEGTSVHDHETGELLADLEVDGDRWLASPGGQGGRGNASFGSNRLRAPTFAEQGEVGLETWYRLQLRLFADVALVGFPSAGKSTLISVVSAAKPKIADYPFTTLEPNLGVVKLDAESEFVIADLPGLIEGAADGRGLGHQFLRHIERARVIAYILDLASVDGESPARQLEVLKAELGAYRPDLLERPSLVIGAKVDQLTAEDWGDDAVVDFEVSSITRTGLKPMLWAMSRLVGQARAEEPDREGYVVHRPEPAGVAVQREIDGTWRVIGRQAQRAVALSDMTNIMALDQARKTLTKIGVDRALKRAGVVEGETVHIGTFSFDYIPDF